MAPYIGSATSRVDGFAKVTGAAKYAAEFNVSGLVHASLVCSTIAKGRITHIDASALRDAEVSPADKGQSQGEGGCRFLKAPLFFVSSLFVKKPSRIEGLRMVITLAWFVYSSVKIYK